MGKSLRGGKDAKLMVVSTCTSCPPPHGTTTTASTAMTPVTTRHNVAAVPLQIPTKSKRESSAFATKYHHQGRHQSQRPRDVCSPDAVPPSIHALLAVTTIPRPKGGRGTIRRKQLNEDANTLVPMIEGEQVPEKELSISFSRSPMDVLLADPADLTDSRDDDASSFNDGLMGSFSSTRTVSLESVPSLSGASSPLDASLSTGFSPVTPPYRGRRRPSQPTRRSLQPVSSSSTGEPVAHPLSSTIAIEELDFRVFDPSPAASAKRGNAFSQLPLKSAFKSNLTASLRAIRSAAKSFSSLTLVSIPPEDLLTRSILTIDPKVPYTDERRPPVLDEEPSAALRRYLNPTTGSPMEPNSRNLSRSLTRSFAASIQMQTYRVQRSQGPMSASTPSPGISRSSSSSSSCSSQSYPPQPQSPNQTSFSSPPGAMRQREMRENPDFIRIAVLEMAMRKRGKLDDQRPGRARWALPPRKPITKPYEVRSDGIPTRWVPVNC
ncbi:hypothetical protein jhhlp_000046 [Lomentospora prolificans]|uniref:Uncharacterized protein n=1 Tax=Lomentospora prolificans TaxID=41688 RepID=A0A2N3NLE3_9PEZI|nr:hypothetical protein jhhlp_000046 [Lomentospora prolificans]